jgi:hypothetical protein
MDFKKLLSFPKTAPILYQTVPAAFAPTGFIRTAERLLRRYTMSDKEIATNEAGKAIALAGTPVAIGAAIGVAVGGPVGAMVGAGAGLITGGVIVIANALGED